MIRHIFLMLLMAGALLMPGNAAAESASHQGAELITLPNGLTVLVQKDTRFPLASLRLYVRAGSAYEHPDTAGISHLLEHMVFKGTERRDGGEVAQAIESVGGNINAATSFDYTVYLTDVPSEHWALGMDVLQDMVFGSVFDPDELEQEKKVVLAELERGEDNPSQRIFKAQQDKIWKGTSYARPIIGYRETVSSITRDDILAYINRLYQPQSMLLVVVGDVDTDAVLAEAKDLFGTLQNDQPVYPAPSLGVTAGDSPGPVVEVQKGPWNKVYLSVAFPMPGSRSSESVGLYFLSQLLGGDNTSRFYRTFKYEKRLVHDISASALDLERTGMFYITATLDEEKLPLFWDEFLRELDGLDAASFTDQEMDRTLLNLEDSLYRTKETLAGLASKLGYFQFFENSLEAEQNYIYDLRSVDRKSLQTLMDEYLRPDRLQATVLATEKSAFDGEALAQTVQNTWTMDVRAAEAAADAELPDDAVVEDLGKGRTLVLLPDETLPYTSLDIVFRGGDGLLAEDEQGLAELAARVLPKGTENRTATDIQDFLADRAAHLNANAIRDLFTVNAKFPTRFTDDVLGLVEEVLTAPSFSAKETANEADNVTASIKSRMDQPLGLAFRHIFPFLFKGHHYGYFHQGDPEKLQLYTPEAVREYWSRQRTQPWTMAVSGDFDPKAVRALAKALAEDLPATQKLAFTPPEWSPEKQLDLTLKGRNQEHLLMVFPAPASNHPDSPGLMLLRSILAGQSGLLFSDLRDEQGLAYTVTAFLWQGPSAGFLAFYIGTYPDKAEQALAGFRDTAARLIEQPLEPSKVERGRNVLQGEYYREHQSLSSRSHEAATLTTQGLPLTWNKDQITALGDVTAEDLQELARKYLNVEDAYLLRVEP